jgi:multiple sugar transport system ATP-binding protein
MAQVTLENLIKKFDEVVAVNNINLTIPDREFVVLVGPSGCGKTTTLRCIAGLEDVTDGEIYIGDRAVKHVPPKDRNIAMVFQNYALYPHMSVYKNMAFGLKIRKTDKTEIDRRVKNAARILGIEELMQRKPKQLSGGQRQRVAVGRAIVRNPQVFLLDEPLSNLDAKLRVQMRAELIKLHRQLDATMIYVTHDQVEAMTMGDRIVVMKDGVIQQVGDPLNLYDYPVNKFVAGFIGSPAMNFLPGTVKQNGADMTVDFGSFALDVPKQLRGSTERFIGKEVHLGIRPEDIHDLDYSANVIHPSPPVDAHVEVYEPLGSESILELKIHDLNFVAQVNPKTSARTGGQITICFDLDKVHIFDPETENVVKP